MDKQLQTTDKAAIASKLGPEDKIALLKGYRSLAEFYVDAFMVPRSYWAKKVPDSAPEGTTKRDLTVASTAIVLYHGHLMGMTDSECFQSLYPVNGKVSLYGQRMMMNIQAHPNFKTWDFEPELDQAGLPISVKLTVVDSQDRTHEVLYTRAMAEQAGLWKNWINKQ